MGSWCAVKPAEDAMHVLLMQHLDVTPKLDRDSFRQRPLWLSFCRWSAEEARNSLRRRVERSL